MTTEFKLVPATLVARAIEALTRHLSQHAPMQVPPSENDSDLVREDLRVILAAPSPPQPIYDEAKERELFEDYHRNSCGLEGRDLESEFHRDSDGEYIYCMAQDGWKYWSACAQSSAKAGEVGHE
jgi:hypothetical protein